MIIWSLISWLIFYYLIWLPCQGGEYLTQLKSEREALDQEISCLRSSVETLTEEIARFQAQLPTQGSAPKTTVLNRCKLWFIDRLICWLIDLLIDWLIDTFIDLGKVNCRVCLTIMLPCVLYRTGNTGSFLKWCNLY